jgi:hypothetical protein
LRKIIGQAVAAHIGQRRVTLVLPLPGTSQHLRIVSVSLMRDQYILAGSIDQGTQQRAVSADAAGQQRPV